MSEACSICGVLGTHHICVSPAQRRRNEQPLPEPCALFRPQPDLPVVCVCGRSVLDHSTPKHRLDAFPDYPEGVER